MNKNNYYFLFPLIFGIVLAYVILFLDCGGMSFMDGVVIAIIGVIGALIGVIITGFISYMQLKRDGKSIDKIGSETAKMEPKIETIEKSTSKSRELLAETINPNITIMKKQQEELNGKVNFVVNEFEYQNRLKNEYSLGLNKDILTSGIDLVYEKNASLEKQLYQSKTKVIELENKIIRLENENERLNNELENYENHSMKRNRGISL